MVKKVPGTSLLPSSIVIADNEIHVWLEEVDQSDPQKDSIGAEILSADELERAARYRFPSDRRLFRFAHTFLRQTLGKYLNANPAKLQFTIGDHGRPELAGLELRFNLTHTKGLVGCIVTRSMDCGVDAEAIDRRADHELLSRKVFTETEQAAFLAAPASERYVRFFQMWTLKEAYIKARGLGMALPLREISFDLTAAEPTASFGPNVGDTGNDWRYWSGKATERHVYGVAVRCGLKAVLKVFPVAMSSSLEPHR